MWWKVHKAAVNVENSDLKKIVVRGFMSDFTNIFLDVFVPTSVITLFDFGLLFFIVYDPKNYAQWCYISNVLQH